MEESWNHLCEQSSKGFAKGTKDQKLNVYVWDMDETIILLKSLLDGTYAEAFCGSKDVKRGEELGKSWEKQILDLCDHHFFYEQVRLRFHSIIMFQLLLDITFQNMTSLSHFNADRKL